MKLHLGCGWRDFGSDWTHIDDGDYSHLEYKTSIDKLPMVGDNSVDLIYASHCIAYFDRDEIKKVLREWKRVLKPKGLLRLGTPDLSTMIKLYQNNNEYDINNMLGPLYGKMPMDTLTIYHKTTYDYDSLKQLLEENGFSDVKYWDWRETEHSDFDDHSQSYYPHMDKENGTLISLNLQCVK